MLTSRGPCSVLCGFSNARVELWEVPSAVLLAAWTAEANSGAVKHILLRPAPNAKSKVVAVVAQAGRVSIAMTGSSALTKLLPNEAVADSLLVSSLQAVGDTGFAVCSSRHVYAFEAQESDPAVLKAVVELPGAEVRHFHATPYEFFVVFGSDGAAQRSAVSCLWPLCVKHEDEGIGGHSVSFKAWVPGGTNSALRETRAEAVDVGKILLRTTSPIEAMALNQPHAGEPGHGLLAVSAVGSGVGVFTWGIEANPHVEQVRALIEKRANEQAKMRHTETQRRQLQRLQQRLQEMDKLEAKSQEKGLEALSEDEQAKLQRRGKVELEIERLTQELGLDTTDQVEEEAKEEAERELVQADARKKREKEKVQKKHMDDKRALQKERRQLRDRKFTD